MDAMAGDFPCWCPSVMKEGRFFSGVAENVSVDLIHHIGDR